MSKVTPQDSGTVGVCKGWGSGLRVYVSGLALGVQGLRF